ncbi:MarR family winged helix-turn-helix transcriptional regulator [Sinorhizobium mexicanum]|uniref:MarR family transcriptional regulator n=1 Tax=Sinorhizobium mexicanum TaxID=375549 RepID=A0A859R137_9HYPH|nr:helix-turn-helix domain-containing protein [Sinorhizobium mexicanum]MBP1884443.1 DNA-binding MarR family transcriptional regulator [Sinorhizobium mexicanum]QLL66246.1 MarR family transcriptional regulator [Sinorhizobium mexicanum]
MGRLEAELTRADYESLATLRYTLRKFLDFSTSAAQEAGLPPQQHQALLAIKGLPVGETMTVGMLAEKLLIAPHTATELATRLVKAGYVLRATDAADKRRQTLNLTEKAEASLRHLSAIHLREIKIMAPELIALLARLNDKASAQE